MFPGASVAMTGSRFEPVSAPDPFVPQAVAAAAHSRRIDVAESRWVLAPRFGALRA